MNIVIIEDELITAEDLKDTILQVDESVEIIAVLHSVNEAIHYFKNNPAPQLIFSDIQLGDGQSFEIFSEVGIKAPIIFCTAYDEYAIEAFNANGIHYILKPFNKLKIQEALEKYNTLQATFTNESKQLDDLFERFSTKINQDSSKKVSSILVYYQNRVIPIKLVDIALFFIKNDTTHLYTFDHKTFVVNKTLDELQQFDNHTFYRANRQYIINRDAVKEANHYLSRKVSIELNVPFEEVITISKEKITPFFEWLSGTDLS